MTGAGGPTIPHECRSNPVTAETLQASAPPADPVAYEPGNPPGWDTLEYRGYRGAVIFDVAADELYGHVANIRPDGINFVGRTTEELRVALRESVDEYLAYCEKRGHEPCPPLPGPCGEPYLTHLPYHACRAIEAAAHAAGQSVGEWVAARAAEAVADPPAPHRPPADAQRAAPKATAARA